MDETKINLVMLRQPRRNDPNEMRTDPLWEFGSFGCTRCHRRNLMNPKKLIELEGRRLAFVQNGPLGFKLVHVTPPVSVCHHGTFGEVKWSPVEMPLTYDSAPTLVNNLGMSDCPELFDIIMEVCRERPIAKFTSKFRSRRQPLPTSLGRQIVEIYERRRSGCGRVARSYVDALPCEPPRLDRDREATYQRLLRKR